MARHIDGSAGMGSFAVLSLGTQWLDILMGVLVWEVLLSLATARLDCLFGALLWEVLSRIFATWNLLFNGFLCHLERHF